jgi:2,3-bisphosphoglycerate-independent phosphoglycerate mutase
MDALARQGLTGLMDIIGPGIKVGTDIGHLALFGQDAGNDAYRRGPMEAVGAGLELRPGAIAIRFNFATLDGNRRILDRRAGRIREEIEALIEALNRISLDDPVHFRFSRATEHRGVLVLSGDGLSAAISDTDPGDLLTTESVLPSQATEDDPSAHRTAAIVNRLVELSHEVLKDHPVNIRRRQAGKHPANVVLTRGAGIRQGFINLPERLDRRVVCVSGESTVLGIAELAGMDIITSRRMTANLDTDLDEKGARTIQALGVYDLVYLHLKGCDIAGHDRRPEAKRDFIERTDCMLGEILRQVGHLELQVALAADHATPVATGEHSGDPVPVLVAGPTVKPDSVQRYGERFCARGGLGRVLCADFLDTLLATELVVQSRSS